MCSTRVASWRFFSPAFSPDTHSTPAALIVHNHRVYAGVTERSDAEKAPPVFLTTNAAVWPDENLLRGARLGETVQSICAVAREQTVED
jgi:hypothetical protein